MPKFLIVLFGLVPALRTLHVDLVESLREGGQHATAGHRRRRRRAALVAVEVALAVMLVIGAGLMVRTLAALGDIDLGFNPDRVLTMRVTIPASKYSTHENVVDFFDELQKRANALPGVEAAGIVRALRPSLFSSLTLLQERGAVPRGVTDSSMANPAREAWRRCDSDRCDRV